MSSDYLNVVAQEVSSVLAQIDRVKLEKIVSMLSGDKRVFVDGEGRSGFVGKCFAMRMMHLGYEVYVMGETNTPSFKADDVYISISGSGNSGSVVLNAKNAQKKEARLISLVGNLDSTLAQLSDESLFIPATTRQDTVQRNSIQLLGSLFDQSTHLILDTVCLMISEISHISNAEATKRHI